MTPGDFKKGRLKAKMSYKIRYFTCVRGCNLFLHRQRLKRQTLPRQQLMLTAYRPILGEGSRLTYSICSYLRQEKLVTNSRFSLLPCKSRSRTVYNPRASHRWNSGSTKSVSDFQAPLTRTHHLPPPYCLSSLPRSSDNTTHTHTLALASLIGRHSGVRFIFSTAYALARRAWRYLFRLHIIKPN